MFFVWFYSVFSLQRSLETELQSGEHIATLEMHTYSLDNLKPQLNITSQFAFILFFIIFHFIFYIFSKFLIWYTKQGIQTKPQQHFFQINILF